MEQLKKFWEWLKKDSWGSWVVSLIIAFIIVKFIFFPLLSLALATKLPLVVVESSSMHHSGSFFGNTLALQKNFELWWEEKGSWYENREIKKQDAKNWAMKTGLEAGDIIVVSGWDKKLEMGDIIIFNADQKHPVIHRIIGITKINDQLVYSTKGDNNPEQLLSEREIKEKAIVGKAVFRIPKLGWIKLAFVRIFT